MSSAEPPSWSLRPVTVDDREFLYVLKEQTLREYIDATWGWDDAAQRRWFDDEFEVGGASRIIQVDGEDIGMVDVAERPDSTFLSNLRVTPAWQGRGVGTAVVRWVVDGSTKPVALHVLKVNERAKRLYEREGFRVVDETETHYVMQRG